MSNVAIKVPEPPKEDFDITKIMATAPPELKGMLPKLMGRMEADKIDTQEMKKSLRAVYVKLEGIEGMLKEVLARTPKL